MKASDKSKVETKKGRSIMRAMIDKMQHIRSVRLSRDKSPDKATAVQQQQKNVTIERLLAQRLQAWSKAQNLPEWAQAKMAQSLIKEDERRKRRAELEAKKLELLKHATLKHAIVVGVKAAEEIKKKAEEAKNLIPELRKGDSPIPYKLQSLDLDNLVSSTSEKSSSISTSLSSDKPEVRQQAAPAQPVDQKAAKQTEDCLMAILEKASIIEPVPNPTAVIGGVLPDEDAIDKYVAHLDENDLWERESDANALYNWMISQTSPDDLKNKLLHKEGPRIGFDATVVGKTFPSKQKVYDKNEPSDNFEGKMIG